MSKDICNLIEGLYPLLRGYETGCTQSLVSSDRPLIPKYKRMGRGKIYDSLMNCLWKYLSIQLHLVKYRQRLLKPQGKKNCQITGLLDETCPLLINADFFSIPGNLTHKHSNHSIKIRVTLGLYRGGYKNIQRTRLITLAQVHFHFSPSLTLTYLRVTLCLALFFVFGTLR